MALEVFRIGLIIPYHWGKFLLRTQPNTPWMTDGSCSSSQFFELHQVTSKPVRRLVFKGRDCMFINIFNRILENPLIMFVYLSKSLFFSRCPINFHFPSLPQHLVSVFLFYFVTTIKKTKISHLESLTKISYKCYISQLSCFPFLRYASFLAHGY